jgi:hypothetical protein
MLKLTGGDVVVLVVLLGEFGDARLEQYWNVHTT